VARYETEMLKYEASVAEGRTRTTPSRPDFLDPLDAREHAADQIMCDTAFSIHYQDRSCTPPALAHLAVRNVGLGPAYFDLDELVPEGNLLGSGIRREQEEQPADSFVREGNRAWDSRFYGPAALAPGDTAVFWIDLSEHEDSEPDPALAEIESHGHYGTASCMHRTYMLRLRYRDTFGYVYHTKAFFSPAGRGRWEFVDLPDHVALAEDTSEAEA